MEEKIAVVILSFLLVGSGSLVIGVGAARSGEELDESLGLDDEYELQDAQEITDWHDLDDVRNDLDGYHVLMNDLDENTEGYGEYNTGDGWNPIGEGDDEFEGSFDGQGFEIRGLYIDRSGGNIGLFGETGGGSPDDPYPELTNLGLVDVDVTGGGYEVGGLVGDQGGYGTISNCYVTGEVTNEDGRETGGLVGRNNPGDIYNSYSTADVTSEGGRWLDGRARGISWRS